MVEIYIFILGISLGSFINVVAYRLPLKKSIIFPSSSCISCNAKIPFWANVPVLGFLFVKGRCVNCKEKISVQYPIVELLAGLITVLCYYKYGISILFFVYVVFIYFLLTISLIDIKTRLIYDKILVIMLALGVLVQLILPFTLWMEALYGFFAGGLSMFLISILGKFAFKKESLGMGDVKLAAVSGFFVGWFNVLIALYFGFVLAFLTMIIIARIKKIQLTGFYFPFGPFIAGGLIIFLFWGNEITALYLNMVL